MQSLLTIIGAVVALVAASVGVIAAIEQLTLRARLRRTAELAQVLSAQENDSERQTVLRSLYTLFRDPHIFHRYVIASSGPNFDDEANYACEHDRLP